jgi:predicted negative regulator of RcsB-dependent stress response
MTWELIDYVNHLKTKIKKQQRMKTTGIILIVICSMLLLMDIGFGIYSDYQYTKTIKSYWNLADKASSIEQKVVGIDKFIQALEKSELQGQYNAIIFTTPDNSFDQNFIAVKSLQKRMHEIQTMDVTSFQYNTAIQQITQQEQGEANDMMQVFRGCWYKEHYFLLWNWICGLQVIMTCLVLISGIVLLALERD